MHQHDPAPAGDPRDLAGPFYHRMTIPVRFADTDAQGHVNNAVYLTYCESARIRYWTEVSGEPFAPGIEGGLGLILADARITYRAQVFYGELVTVETRVARIGRSSFDMEQRLVAAGPDGPTRLAAVSGSVLVRYDYTSAHPVPLSAPHIAALEAYEGRALRGAPPP